MQNSEAKWIRVVKKEYTIVAICHHFAKLNYVIKYSIHKWLKQRGHHTIKKSYQLKYPVWGLSTIVCDARSAVVKNERLSAENSVNIR